MSTRGLKQLLSLPEQLENALFDRKPDLVKTLLKKPELKDPNVYDADGDHILAFPSGKGDAEILKLLLAHPKTNPDDSQDNGLTPLMWACLRGKVTTAAILIATPGVKVNRRNRFGRTAFYYACCTDHFPLIDLFLRYADSHKGTKEALDFGMPADPASEGYDMNIDSWLLPTEPAKHKVRTKVQALKIHLGARGKWLEPTVDTPKRLFMLACLHGDVDKVSRMIAQGADINAPDLDGITPLMSACSGITVQDPNIQAKASKRAAKIVGMLLARDEIDVNARDSAGRTAFFFACCMNQRQIIKTYGNQKHEDPVTRKWNYTLDVTTRTYSGIAPKDAVIECAYRIDNETRELVEKVIMDRLDAASWSKEFERRNKREFEGFMGSGNGDELSRSPKRSKAGDASGSEGSGGSRSPTREYSAVPADDPPPEQQAPFRSRAHHFQGISPEALKRIQARDEQTRKSHTQDERPEAWGRNSNSKRWSMASTLVTTTPVTTAKRQGTPPDAGSSSRNEKAKDQERPREREREREKERQREKEPERPRKRVNRSPSPPVEHAAPKRSARQNRRQSEEPTDKPMKVEHEAPISSPSSEDALQARVARLERRCADLEKAAAVAERRRAEAEHKLNKALEFLDRQNSEWLGLRDLLA